jgi:hypothetical protein
MPFHGDVVVRELGGHDGSRWRLVEPLRYDGKHEQFVVPAGFTTDFASVPRALTWLVPRYGRYTKAAILHDCLWRRCADGEFSWVDADGIFRRVMRELGVPFLRRWLMWGAVRLAGILTRSPSTLWTQGPGNLASLLVITVLGIAFLVVPGLVVVAFLGLFAVLEALTWTPLAGAHRARGGKGKQVNRPRLLLPK